MKKIYTLFLIFLFFNTSAQDEKRDYTWLLGYENNLIDTTFGGMRMEFNDLDTFDLFYEYRDIDFYLTNSSICDEEGDLVFYTNGISLLNAADEIIEHGDTLISGNYTEDWSDWGYAVLQGILTLPAPESNNLYNLFHSEHVWGNFQGNIVYAIRFWYSIIDMNENNGQGKITLKNELLVQDTLAFGKVTATRHANGVDWWIIVPQASSNLFYTYSLTSNGVEDKGTQVVGDSIIEGIGQAVFSPDGTKYAKGSLVSSAVGGFLDIYDFDRCTGELSNPTQMHLQAPIGSLGAGLSFSPNSRWLYLSAGDYVIQYDTEAIDIALSADTVAVYDGFLTPPASTRFFVAQLAPDNKIYISTPATTRYLHVINQPDLQGIACDVQQHSIFLPTRNNRSLPNYPYFRLGASAEPCETSISTLKEDDQLIKVFPNPTSQFLHIQLDNNVIGNKFTLHNGLGMEVLSLKLEENETILNLSHLENGIYFYSIAKKMNLVTSGKLILQKDD